MAKKKTSKKTNAETSGSGQEGHQLELIDVGPEHSEEIENATDQWKALIKKRLSLQAKEAEVKAELMGLIRAENLTRLKDGSIKCRCQGWMIEIKPVEEKLTATRLSD